MNYSPEYGFDPHGWLWLWLLLTVLCNVVLVWLISPLIDQWLDERKGKR